MLTALTQMAASTVLVEKALKAMDSTVQVYTLCIANTTCMVTVFKILLQTFRSVNESLMTVTQMPTVQTHLEVITVVAMLDSLGMDLHVQVSNCNFLWYWSMGIVKLWSDHLKCH